LGEGLGVRGLQIPKRITIVTAGPMGSEILKTTLVMLFIVWLMGSEILKTTLVTLFIVWLMGSEILKITFNFLRRGQI